MENQNEVEQNVTVEDAIQQLTTENKGQTEQVALIASLAVALLGQDNSTSIIGPNSEQLAAPYAQAALGLLKASHIALVNEQQKAFDQIQEMVSKSNAYREVQREEAAVIDAKEAYAAMDEGDLNPGDFDDEAPPKQSALVTAMKAATEKLAGRAADTETDNE